MDVPGKAGRDPDLVRYALGIRTKAAPVHQTIPGRLDEASRGSAAAPPPADQERGGAGEGASSAVSRRVQAGCSSTGGCAGGRCLRRLRRRLLHGRLPPPTGGCSGGVSAAPRQESCSSTGSVVAPPAGFCSSPNRSPARTRPWSAVPRPRKPKPSCARASAAIMSQRSTANAQTTTRAAAQLALSSWPSTPRIHANRSREFEDVPRPSDPRYSPFGLRRTFHSTPSLSDMSTPDFAAVRCATAKRPGLGPE